MAWNDIATTIGAIAAVPTIIAAIYAGYRWSYKKGYETAKKDILESHYKQQYEEIYAPLRAAFLEIQVTSATSAAFPFLRQRIRRAFRLLNEGKLRKAIRAISDKGVSGPSAEIEFGPGFPLSKIQNLLTQKSSLANPEIMNLFQRADRAQYESQIVGGRDYDNELLPEEYELFIHIVEKYRELSERFG